MLGSGADRGPTITPNSRIHLPRGYPTLIHTPGRLEELLVHQMRPRTHAESAVVRSRFRDRDDALRELEDGFMRVLVLVSGRQRCARWEDGGVISARAEKRSQDLGREHHSRPWLCQFDICPSVLAVRKSDVRAVEAHDELVGAPKLLERSNHPRLTASQRPCLASTIGALSDSKKIRVRTSKYQKRLRWMSNESEETPILAAFGHSGSNSPSRPPHPILMSYPVLVVQPALPTDGQVVVGPRTPIAPLEPSAESFEP